MLIKRRKKLDLDPFREPDEIDEEHEQRQQQIETAIDRRTTEIRRGQVKHPMADRLTDDQCREQAEKEVFAAIAAKERAERAARLRADVASALTRNDYLIKPWVAGCAYAGVGEIAAILAETGTLNELGAFGLAAGGGAVISAVVWRRIKKMIKKYWSRMRAGVFAGAVTSTVLPIVPWDWQGGVLAAGTLSLVASCAQYWSDNAPAYPPMGGWDADPVVDVEEAVTAVTGPRPTKKVTKKKAAGAPQDEPESDSDMDDESLDIIADWDEFVRSKRILSGAILCQPVQFEHGWVFTVKLVRGKQKFENLQRALPDIAAALNYPADSVTADPNPDEQLPLEPQLTITTSKPDNTYTGPVIVREGRDVYIELGPYTDGRGVVRHHLLADQLTDEELARGEKPRGSAIGGFVLGDKGSGKTRLIETIALGAMEAGVEVWYVDPQGGASSPLLRDHAAWPLMGLDSSDGKRAFGNIEDLLDALDGVCATRQDENSDRGWTGFQHTADRPMILVVIDECHLVFERYGKDFGDIDRISRKLGIAFFGGSQSGTQDVFGGEITLRNGMAGGNGYLLKFNGSNAGLAFGALNPVAARGCRQLRPNLTLGYATNSDRPGAVFQNRFTPNLEPFFAELKPVTLDPMSAYGAGEAYARRFETAEENLAAVRARLEGYRNGTLKPKRRKTTKKKGRKGKAADEEDDDGDDTGGSSNVSYLFPGSRSGAGGQDQEQGEDTDADGLTERQRKIVELLTGARMASSMLTAKNLAEQLGKTPRTINTDLRVLRQKKIIRVVDEHEGTYTVLDDFTAKL